MDRKTITVILTAYKRIENLPLQLASLEAQTVKPDEILLFQDGIDGDNKVVISEDVLKKFDKVHICDKNYGVWERFRYAMNANSDYVCIFDDDTIPGNLWLENCLTEMQKQEGIYGTIGIVMQKPENYPLSDYIRVGWSNPCKTTKEVDFVGHSWFFKKEWLNCMFNNTEELQAYKTAGEDMSLSAMAQKYMNIKTFIPPHPMNNKNLWGSNPEYAEKLGTSKTSISLNKDNLNKMNECINILLKSGYKTLSQRDAGYVKKMYKANKLSRKLTALVPFKKFRHHLRMLLCEKFYD